MDRISISLRELMRILEKIKKEKKHKVTLLGIGPMSFEVIQCAIELGRDEEFPVVLIPSRNQVDIDEFGSGYVSNFDQKRFSKKVKDICEEASFKGILYLWRDHGGPWQRDEDYKNKLDIEPAIERAKKSFEADLLSDFTVVHVDPTKDPHTPGNIKPEEVIERIVTLIKWIEEKKKELKIKFIDYEVGTEEQKGGATTVESFERFLELLSKSLLSSKLPEPVFVVGQTGTLLKMNKNIGKYNIEIVEKLSLICQKYGMYLKEHNTDYVSEELLKMHPEAGVGMANVAPEFAHAQTQAYLEISEKENQLIKKNKNIKPSGFYSIISKAVLESGRWKKWLTKEESHLTENDIIKDEKKMKEIILINAHYVYNDKNVREAIKQMFENVKKSGIEKNPENFVKENIKNSIRKYIKCFNLSGLTELVKSFLIKN